MALTEPEVELVIGLAGAFVTYLTTRQVKARRSAKRKLSEDVRALLASKDEQLRLEREQIVYLRGELRKARTKGSGSGQP